MFSPSVEPLVMVHAMDVFPGGKQKSSNHKFSLVRDCRWCKCTLSEAMPESEVDFSCK